MTGNATRVAAEMLLNAMRKDDGTFRTYEEMTAENIPTYYEGTWAAAACTDCDLETAQGAPFSNYMYELFIPEVEVNMETGKVRVIRLTTVCDFGTIINKIVVDGQVYGGCTQGIGLALTEDFEDYSRHTTLKGCGIPYPEDVPDDFNIIYTETPRPLGPFGASAVLASCTAHRSLQVQVLCPLSGLAGYASLPTDNLPSAFPQLPAPWFFQIKWLPGYVLK